MKYLFGYLLIFAGFICFLSGCSTYEETGAGLFTAGCGAFLIWVGYCLSDLSEQKE